MPLSVKMEKSLGHRPLPDGIGPWVHSNVLGRQRQRNACLVADQRAAAWNGHCEPRAKNPRNVFTPRRIET